MGAFDLGNLHIQGWHPGRPDHRDHLMSLVRDVAPEKAAALPDLLDMRAACPPIDDQGQLGSCTAFAVGFIWDMAVKEMEGHTVEELSFLKLYYDTRVLLGTVKRDSGASINLAMKAALANGLTHSHLCPYIIQNFKNKPSMAAVLDGKKNVPTGKMVAVVPQDADSIDTLLGNAHPVAFGFSVPQSFMTRQVAQTGIFKGPLNGEPVVGGHAVALVGRDKKRGVYFVRNSWSTQWGMDGYWEAPAEFILNPAWCTDFHAAVSGPNGY